MNKLIEKPQLIFLLSTPIIVLFGILNRDAVLDINVHDTYFVIAYYHLAILISILFGIIGVGYWIMNKMDITLNKSLNFIHIILTYGSLIFTYLFSLFMYKENEFPLFDQTSKVLIAETITVFLILIGIFIFLINIIIGFLIRKNKTSG